MSIGVIEKKCKRKNRGIRVERENVTA